MARNLTPEHMRCGPFSSCPSIHELEDGRLLIVGEAAALSTVGREAVRELRDAGKIADTEFAIAIDRELLSALGVAPKNVES